MPVLFQAVPKAGRMDSVVEKVTELGIARIVPFLSSRTVVKLSQSQARKKIARWKRIAVSAAKQSGLDWVPGIDSVVRFDGLQDVFGQMDVVLAGSLEPGASHIRDVLRGLTAEIRKPGVLIGPEGDFTSVEMETARNWGAVPVCFGPTVLRTDTAAIYAASIFAYEFGK
jgi:16S rRNA (uracil1498-N3)-methyltransferase